LALGDMGSDVATTGRWRQLAGLLGCALSLGLVSDASRGLRGHGAIRQEAYVWQLLHTAQVEDALRERLVAFDEAAVLAAEVRIESGQVVVQRARLSPALAASNKPVTLVVRVGPRPLRGAFGDRVAALVRELATDRQPPRRHEIQVDYDCPTRLLATYARWLAKLRREVPAGMRLSATTLPDWLAAPAMADLVAPLDRFVLQVHSVERPGDIGQPVRLFDAGRARAWIERAADLEHPFSLALPSYGYEVRFSEDGGFVGLVAEGYVPADARTQSRLVLADAAGVSQLLSALRRDRPQSLSGVAWFRLPVDGDRSSWAWPTLQAVMRGAPLNPELQVQARAAGPELVELVLRNHGNVHAAMPLGIEVRHRALGSADGQAGFVVQNRAPGRLTLAPASSTATLAPGESRVVGWVRVADGAPEVRLHVAES
jgi:Protein of unknown function (DUF3142)